MKESTKNYLNYYTYIDMEKGNDIESIDFDILCNLLDDLIKRIETIETKLKINHE